ncbi:hypothetical protein [Nonomuraea dietziae]|uniref:hypothetical protein n=1 Tax=Nonomuraea dietziae TaxID=65515 RepID=UPI0031D0E0DF
MDTWDELMQGRPGVPVKGVGMGVPRDRRVRRGPHRVGRVMASWTGVVIPPLIRERFPCRSSSTTT